MDDFFDVPELLPGSQISLFPPVTAISTLPLVWKGPIVTRKNAHDKYIVWQIGFDENTKKITVVHGELTGKKISHQREIEPKAGRTISQQGYLEARQKYLKKRDSSYKSGELAEELAICHKPMTAKTYVFGGIQRSNPGKILSFPVSVEAKCDGIRCLASYSSTNKADLISRSNKPLLYLDHIRNELVSFFERIPTGSVLDGEIYHPRLDFNKIQSAVMTKKHPGPYNDQLYYYIFDIITPDPNTITEHRKAILEEAFKDAKFKYLVFVPMFIIYSEDRVKPCHDFFVENGYEGCMIRQLWNPSFPNKDKLHSLCIYKPGCRSGGLLKVKIFEDQEFIIVGGKEGEGDDKGTVIFRVFDPVFKIEFDVKPQGDRASRREMWLNLSRYIGKQYTVQFMGRSRYNVPRFPSGKSIRED